MFIVKINGTVLHFGIKEFVAVIGLKCGLLTDFVSDPSIPNRLIQKYFGEMTKVPKLDLEANFFELEDRFKIGVMYFIITFLTGSEASKITIPKLYFDLVESGQYVNFPWGNECFRLTLKACSRRTIYMNLLVTMRQKIKQHQKGMMLTSMKSSTGVEGTEG
ncbi:hypothetical protein KY289_021019 [Solanum tuberosum]|nr:hypothetical protein KY289_021019 [Solanum tuberosum]